MSQGCRYRACQSHPSALQGAPWDRPVGELCQEIGPTKPLPFWPEEARLPIVEPFDSTAVRAAYDVAAEDYAEAFADDLLKLVVDREVLDLFVQRTARGEPVLDLGCGPGQIGEYLGQRGLRMVGIDLAFQMLLVARQRTGNRSLVCGDMRSIPLRTGSFSGVVAFYSVHHLPRSALRTALAEIRRILKPGGLLVIATHLGESEVYTNTFLGHEIETVAGTLYGEGELVGLLESESFVVEDIRSRDPLPHEYESGRFYLVSPAHLRGRLRLGVSRVFRPGGGIPSYYLFDSLGETSVNRNPQNEGSTTPAPHLSFQVDLSFHRYSSSPSAPLPVPG